MARWLTLWCAFAATGCGDAAYNLCDRPLSADPRPFTEGTVKNGIYQSSDWNGELLRWPGGAYYQFSHRLGQPPRAWSCYLSFQRDGTNSGSVAQAAGNECELKAIDDQTITLLNDTCVDFYVVVEASTGAALPTPP